MKDVIQIARNVHEFGDIMEIKLELFQGEEVGNIVHTTCEEVVHADDMVSFLNKTVCKVGTEKPGSAGDEYSFHSDSGLSGKGIKNRPCFMTEERPAKEIVEIVW